MNSYSMFPNRSLQAAYPSLFERFSGLPSIEQLGILGPAVQHAAITVKAPNPMTLLVALTAASTVTQALCDVERPVGGKTSLSLHSILIAFSGEGKSALINFFFNQIRNAEIEIEKKHQEDLCNWDRKNNIWQIYHKELKKKLSAAIRGEPNMEEGNYNIQTVTDNLEAHLKEKPSTPKRARFLYEDTTYQALIEGMNDNYDCVCVLGDEGTRTLNRLVTPGISTLNSAWSGQPIIFNRISSKSISIYEPRITLLVAIQPGPFTRYREKSSDQAKEAGFWARAVFCGPHSNIGFRERTSSENMFEYSGDYEKRIKKLVDKNRKRADDKISEKRILKFDEEARELYFYIVNEIETLMRPGGIYQNAIDHASKLMENITRVAAILHVINKYNENISYATLNTSIQICVFYSQEYISLFDEQPQYFFDAQALDDWLTCNVRNNNLRFISKRYVRQHCTGSLRKSNKFREALEHLVLNGQITVFQNDTKTWIIDTFPRT